jgi:hypothetical protein
MGRSERLLHREQVLGWLGTGARKKSYLRSCGSTESDERSGPRVIRSTDRSCAARELLRATTALLADRSWRSAHRGACCAGRRLALFDEAPSAFVIMVGVMGENADRHTLL